MAGLYVHIPFCKSKCIYCDFYSTPRSASAPAVVDGILAEYAARSHETSEAYTTLYFGGGTPSSLPVALLQRLVYGLINPAMNERTIEVNPDDVTGESASRWLALGFNRASMGVQSLDDNELRRIGRRHTAAEAVAAYHTLRDAGFGNISLDLIYGLPGQTFDSWQQSLDALLSMRPDHLSAYCLSYEPGTPLYRQLESGRIRTVDDDVIGRMYDYLCAASADAGYRHYEISNFALPGMHSRHNSAYWDGTPYLGLGPSAHSYDGALRRYNPSSIDVYLSSLPVAAVVDAENENERFNDIVITALRTSAGLDLGRLPAASSRRLLNDASAMLATGRLRLTDNTLTIPEPYWLSADAILRALIRVD